MTRPTDALRRIARYTINRRVQHAVAPRSAGVNIPAADWDVLVVLDGCRADTFEDVAPISTFDQYRPVQSRASMTAEWLAENFPNEYGSMVYVSGNPIVSRDAPARWHRLIEAWKDGFDRDFGQVHADAVTDSALDAAAEYDDKRVVAHYMQPHAPFVGHPELHFNSWAGFEELGATFDGHPEFTNVWEAAAAGVVDHDDVWEGYRDNLRYVLPEVERLIDGLPAGTRVVVTSDHGNVIKARDWPLPIGTITGHPRDVRHRDLITVPWAVLTAGRRTVRDCGVSSGSAADSREVTDRLAALGYGPGERSAPVEIRSD